MCGAVSGLCPTVTLKKAPRNKKKSKYMLLIPPNCVGKTKMDKTEQKQTNKQKNSHKPTSKKLPKSNRKSPTQQKQRNKF